MDAPAHQSPPPPRRLRLKVPPGLFPPSSKDSVESYRIKILPVESKPRCFIGPTHCRTQALLEIYKAKISPITLTKLAAEHLPPNLLVFKLPTIIIGMDVSRDGAPVNHDAPSIAAVVHSRGWPQISEYRAYACTQSCTLEMDTLYKPEPDCDGKLKDFGIISELLQDYCNSSENMKPELIIIFRYGFNKLRSTQPNLDAEVKQIKEACKLFDENWSPKFVVIKFFEPEDTVPSDWDIDGLITIRPLKYKVVFDDVRLNDDGKELVDALSYVHELRTESISLVAPYCYGPKRTELEEHKDKRAKTKVDPDKVDLQRVREFITDGEELAIYALGRLNAQGKKYKFQQYLFVGFGYCGEDSSNMNPWQHVGMYAEELDGYNVSKKIVFAELCYSKGQYEPVVLTVLDPDNREGITYGCGFCFPCFGGPNPSPHPADTSRYRAGHWTHGRRMLSNVGFLRPGSSG